MRNLAERARRILSHTTTPSASSSLTRVHLEQTLAHLVTHIRRGQGLVLMALADLGLDDFHPESRLVTPLSAYLTPNPSDGPTATW